MKKFGILTLNTGKENQYISEIAKRAQFYGFECFRFRPCDIHPVSQLIKGEKYSDNLGEWIPQEFPIPSLLYDRCFYGDEPASQNARAIVGWLKKRKDIQFIGTGLPDKWRVQETIGSSPLKPYLIPTILPNSSNEVIEQVRHYKKVLMKPVQGAGGSGILLLEQFSHGLRIKSENADAIRQTDFPESERAAKWLESLLSKRKYLLQPLMDLRDNDKKPFDIRILLQKNEEGSWRETGKGIRTGKKNGYLSNLRTGGDIHPYSYIQGKLTDSERSYIQEEITDICSRLPDILESAFPSLFEIGLDIGLARNHSIWILDINSKPGHQVILNSGKQVEESIYRAPLQYAKHLVNIADERVDYNEKALSDRKENEPKYQ